MEVLELKSKSKKNNPFPSFPSPRFAGPGFAKGYPASSKDFAEVNAVAGSRTVESLEVEEYHEE
jgi:hypothetical protein